MLFCVLGACGSTARPTQGWTPREHPTPPRPLLAQLESAADLDGLRVGSASGPTVAVTFASWCGHCREELAVLEDVRAQRPHVRWLGLNYRAHEEYGGRGGSAAVRSFGATYPWLRVVPIDEALFTALGAPPIVPTIFVFDREGALVAMFDRRERPVPSAAELAALLAP